MTVIAVVINPIAGGGQGRKVWHVLKPGLSAIFDRIVYRISNRVGDLNTITQDLLAEKPDLLLIVGGDGTLNHVLNGMMCEDKLIRPKTKIAYFSTGTGGDFIRQFPQQKITEFLDRLSHNRFIISNVGKVDRLDKLPYYFINIASCGLSGQVVKATEKSKFLKKLGGTLNYLLHSLSELLKYRKSTVRIQIDDAPAFECSLLMMAICNGQYFGGRMHVAPMAKIDDGLLDMVLFRDFSKLNALFKLRKIYSGSHLSEKNVHYVQGKKVKIESFVKRSILIEADGESIGRLPATFSILENILRIIV